MTVDAGRRVVANEIGVHTQQIEEEQSQSHYHSPDNQQEYFLPIGEDLCPRCQLMIIHRLFGFNSYVTKISKSFQSCNDFVEKFLELF